MFSQNEGFSKLAAKGDFIVEHQLRNDDYLSQIFGRPTEMLKSSQFHDTGFLGELRLEDCDEESYLKARCLVERRDRWLDWGVDVVLDLW